MDLNALFFLLRFRDILTEESENDPLSAAFMAPAASSGGGRTRARRPANSAARSAAAAGSREREGYSIPNGDTNGGANDDADALLRKLRAL